EQPGKWNAISFMKFQKKTFILAGLAAALVLSATVIFFFKESGISPENLLNITSDRADLEVRNALYKELGDDGSKWEIQAEKASYNKKKNLAFFDKIEVKLFLSSGKHVVMKGETGQMNTATKDMQINGKVGITSSSGERFKTDYLHYSYADKRLHTDAAVLMETPRMQIRGVGMSFSLKNRDVVLLSKVRARIK
ncbi:MAG: LPS export ABC transporter periplasmic protein LptC, partial [Syntrophales bacterium]|nr:LPS export ABC transporter periplasmic protein LptC [Syntrophales bacterium]